MAAPMWAASFLVMMVTVTRGTRGILQAFGLSPLADTNAPEASVAARCSARGGRRAGCRRRGAPGADPRATERHFLDRLEIDHRLVVVQNRFELVIACDGQVALRLEDDEARR